VAIIKTNYNEGIAIKLPGNVRDDDEAILAL
jgi:hypothetical protein